ncbi:MAG: ABC transporter permease [Rhodospirillaceae bacterium]|nr:ABC transporter permease [Rhodospirillaceae bacterium]
MGGYLAKRALLALAVAVTVSLVNFTMVLLSGDIAVSIAGPTATYEQLERIRRDLGLDQPIVVQYLRWLGNAVRGDFGDSLFYRTPVADLILERLPVTLTLGISAIVFTILVAIPLGVVAALRPNSWIDRAALSLAVAGQAMPSFWFGLMLIVLFSVMFPILPPSGAESWEYFIMPTVVLGYSAMPAVMRLTRSGMIEVLTSDYIRTAYAKGLRHFKVLFKHALRNAVIPVVSLAAVQFGYMLAGSIIVESIFALHGTGFLAWEAMKTADLPVVQAILFVFSLFYIVLTFLSDMLNAWLDPRIRIG